MDGHRVLVEVTLLVLQGRHDAERKEEDSGLRLGLSSWEYGGAIKRVKEVRRQSCFGVQSNPLLTLREWRRASHSALCLIYLL